MILFVLVIVTSEVTRSVAAAYDDEGGRLNTWKSRNMEQAKLVVKDEVDRSSRSNDMPGYSYIPKHHRLSSQPPAVDDDDQYLYHDASAGWWWHGGGNAGNFVQDIVVVGIFLVILCLAMYVFYTCAANRRKSE